MILAADIGGTKLLFGLFETTGELPVLIFKQRYSSRDFFSLEGAIEAFFASLTSEHPAGMTENFAIGEIHTACFSVAGPVVNGESRLTNLHWEVSKSKLANRFPQIQRILVRNDMEAMVKGLKMADPSDIVSLMPDAAKHSEDATEKPDNSIRKPDDSDKVVGLLAPGTGLGEAYMIGNQAMASEGGHCDFGPQDKLQAELWDFLHRETGHVSYERILCGEGFCRLVRFLMDEKGMDQLDFPLFPEEITRRARVGDDELCNSAVQLFASILGAEAGNLALKTMALDGIYLGGNIVKEILPWLQAPCFSEGFLYKGRFCQLMKTIPVYAVLDTDIVLHGSALMAAETGR